MAPYVGSGAVRALRRDARCRVHSTFERAINVLVDTNMVMLAPSGRDEAANCPFGIEIPLADWNRIRRHLRASSLAPVWTWHRSHQRFRAAGATVLDVASLQGDDLDVPARPPGQWGTPRIDWSAVTPPGAPQSGLLQHHDTEEINARLFSAREALAGRGPLEDAFWLLGRGPGLTPSGDDALVGILAVLATFGGADHNVLLKLAHLLERDGTSITTDVSLAYLQCALRGEYGRSIVRVMVSLGDHKGLALAVRQLLRNGHTSGADVLLGVRSALPTPDRTTRV